MAEAHIPNDVGYRGSVRARTRPRPDEARDYLLLPDEDDDRQEPRSREAAEPPPDPVADARRRRRRWLIAAVVGAVLLIAAVIFAWYWFSTLRWLESTDDAYTQADAVVVAPKVAGYVSNLLVTDNERVKAGQTLLRIDPRDYKTALAQAEANVAAAEADIANIDAQLTMQQAQINQANADIASAQSALTFSQQNYARYAALAHTGAGTVMQAQQTHSDLGTKQATLAHDRAGLKAATDQVAVLKTQRQKSEATLAQDRAQLDQARINVGYTTVNSPVDGAIGDRSVQQGQYVQVGDRLMSIVPMGKSIYVVANFKETEIERMFRGESVDVTIDTFSGIHFEGTVDSLAPGSGAQFALLPPENATGNFTKIVQRVPVKIVLHDVPKQRLDQLRPGLSVVATVDVRTAPPEGQRYTLAAPPRQ
ncbi:MAG TPA: HlyD family secretion protein [Stellaceae bacterium]